MTRPATFPWLLCLALAGVCLLPASGYSQERGFFATMRERFSSNKPAPEEAMPPKKPPQPEKKAAPAKKAAPEKKAAPAPEKTDAAEKGDLEEKDDRNAFTILRERMLGKKDLPEPGDGLVLRDGEVAREQRREGVYADLEAGKKLYQDEKFDDALTVFNSLTRKTKNPAAVLEEALFYKAECMWKQGNYRDAAPAYIKLLHDFRHSARFQTQATQRLFDIANYWLDDTRRQMQQHEENRVLATAVEWVRPASYVSFSKNKPFLDVKGHALQALDEVRLNDINGPLGEKALFYIATVRFFDEDYNNADYYYKQLYENYPKSPLAAKAVKQAILCKQLVQHGVGYDRSAIEEARQLVDTAARAFPEVNGGDDQFLERQLVNISQQQAGGDFEIAEFYRRTGHPGSAYFCYELVRRRYPNTKQAEQATAEMTKIRERAQEKHHDEVSQPAPAAQEAEPGRHRLQGIINPASWWKKQ